MGQREIRCRLEGTTLTLTGELVHRDVGEFEAEIAALKLRMPELRLELAGFELGDGAATVAAVNAVRHVARGRRVVLHGAPQLLAHNLYRIGELKGGQLTLVGTREEEAYG